MGKRIVVALGGNAIVTKTGTADSQIQSIKGTMKTLAQFIAAGDELVITHGNGPQVLMVTVLKLEICCCKRSMEVRKRIPQCHLIR